METTYNETIVDPIESHRLATRIAERSSMIESESHEMLELVRPTDTDEIELNLELEESFNEANEENSVTVSISGFFFSFFIW